MNLEEQMAEMSSKLAELEKIVNGMVTLKHKCEKESYFRTFQVEKNILSTGVCFFCPYCGKRMVVG